MQSPEKEYNRRIFSWTFADWANHAYLTVTASAFLGPYFIAIAAPSFLVGSGEQAERLARNLADNRFAITASVSLLLAAIISPVIGTLADISGKRKMSLLIASAIGGIFAGLMFTITTGLWMWALFLYLMAQIALNTCLGLNSSLLPHVARPDDLNRASSLGYAMGYVGGGLLLLVNAVIFGAHEALGISAGLAVRIAMLSAGVWWALFMIPVWRGVPEPPATPLSHDSRGNALIDAFIRIGHTIRDIRRYRELFKMLIAFLLYMEGVGAIILLATAYGADLGLDTGSLIGTLLMTQFVAFPYAIMFGRIPDPTSRWRGAYVSQIFWTAVTFPIMGTFANNGVVGIRDGFLLIIGSQALGLLFSFTVGRFLFYGIATRLTSKRAIILGVIIYIFVPVWGFFLKTPTEFFMMGYLVGVVQGGVQALSRVVFASMTPKAKSGEFFGLYGLSEKFAGFISPLLYGLVGSITHDPRSSVLSIAVFFVIGILVLWRVNESEGAKLAEEEEAMIEKMAAAE